MTLWAAKATAVCVFGGLGITTVVLLAVYFYCERRDIRKQIEETVKLKKKQDASSIRRYNEWKRIVLASKTMPSVPCNLVLPLGEVCFWVDEGVTLYEVKSVRTSSHTFGSIPITGGIRVGKGISRSESEDEWRPIACGTLYITNKKIFFDGDKQNRTIPLNKVASIKSETSSVEVSGTSRQKSMIFDGANGCAIQDIVHFINLRKNIDLAQDKKSTDGRYILD